MTNGHLPACNMFCRKPFLWDIRQDATFRLRLNGNAEIVTLCQATGH